MKDYRELQEVIRQKDLEISTLNVMVNHLKAVSELDKNIIERYEKLIEFLEKSMEDQNENIKDLKGSWDRILSNIEDIG